MILIEDDPRFCWRGPYRESVCRLRIYEHESGESGADVILIATELDDNPGMSITNATEQLWTAAWKRAEQATGRRGDVTRFFIEHYPGAPGEEVDSAFGEHYSRVTFTGRDRAGLYSGPKWEPITKAQVERLTAPLRLGRPTNLRELVDHLTAHPLVTMTTDSLRIPVGRPGDNPETFLRFADGLLWFKNAAGAEHHLPMHCGLAPAALHESGITIRDDGFNFTKFGTTIRVRYIDGEPSDGQLPTNQPPADPAGQ